MRMIRDALCVPYHSLSGPYHSLSLTRIEFHHPKVTPLAKIQKVTAQELYYCNSNAWGWHNSSYCHVHLNISDGHVIIPYHDIQSIQHKYNFFIATGLINTKLLINHELTQT